MTTSSSLTSTTHKISQVEAENTPEWLIQEDWALLQAVTELLKLPISLQSQWPAHTPNWDLVSDMVNAVSRIFRGPRQCKNRYESIIQPREEGRIHFDVGAAALPPALPPAANNKKGQKRQKGQHQSQQQQAQQLKGLQPLKPNKMKTSQLFSSDRNGTWSALFASRFERIKAVANKRTPTTKPLLVNPAQKNTKHAAVLAESGISYDTPLNPIRVAANRCVVIRFTRVRSGSC